MTKRHIHHIESGPSRAGSYEKPLELRGWRHWAVPSYQRCDGGVSPYVQRWGYVVEAPDGRIFKDYGCATRKQALRIGAECIAFRIAEGAAREALKHTEEA